MEVVNARTALLSNYEVLSLLQETEAQQLAAGTWADMPQNLRLAQSETIGYLTAAGRPTAGQTPASVKMLVQRLAPYRLTKAERLMIANLMPTSTIVLYTIVEEFEERFRENEPEEILQLVQESIAIAAAEGVTVNGAPHTPSGDPPDSTKVNGDVQDEGGEQEDEVVYREEDVLAEMEEEGYAEDWQAPEIGADGYADDDEDDGGG